MGRPLTGSITETDSGFVVSVPEAKGSRRRIRRSFPTLEQAERWRDAAIAAINAGQPVPDADRFRSTAPARTASSGDFAEVAWAWWNQRYVVDQSAGPERRDEVAKHLSNLVIPYFSSRCDEIGDVVRGDVEGFMRFLAGYAEDTATAKAGLPSVARMYTLSEAAQFVGKSKATLRRAFHEGRFPNAVRDTSRRGAQGQVFIPTGDLLAVYPAGGTVRLTAWATTTQRNMLGVLRGIFGYARSCNYMAHDPTEGVVAKKPNPKAKLRKRAPQNRVRALSLAECKRQAQWMTIHHQLAYWLQRCAGLRISEVFGLLVSDIHDDGDIMLIDIWAQGGKTFVVTDENGTERRVRRKEMTKTAAGVRVVPLAEPLAELIRTYLAAFHLDEDTDLSTRPLVVVNRGQGQSAYQSAFDRALERADLGFGRLGFDVDTHHLRKSFSAELQWSGQVPEHVRSRYLGHQQQAHSGGAAVTAKVYSPDMPHIAALEPAARAMSDAIATQVGRLVDPAPIEDLLGRWHRYDQERRAVTEEVLSAAGLVRGAMSPAGESVVSVDEAAGLLGASRTSVWRLLDRGNLEAREITSVQGAPRRMVTVASIEHWLARVQPGVTSSDLAREFSTPPDRVRILARRLGCSPRKAEGRGFVYTDEEAEQIRAVLTDDARLAETTLSITDAAKALGVSWNIARRLVELGELEAVQGKADLRVTRASVESRMEKRTRRASRKLADRAGFIPIEEVMARLGQGRLEVLALAREGVVISRTPDYRFHVEVASLAAYLEGR
jgi:integrase